MRVDIGAHLISGLEVPPPDTMGQTFALLAQAGVLTAPLASSLKKAVGFRNVAVHSYEAINCYPGDVTLERQLCAGDGDAEQHCKLIGT